LAGAGIIDIRRTRSSCRVYGVGTVAGLPAPIGDDDCLFGPESGVARPTIIVDRTRGIDNRGHPFILKRRSAIGRYAARRVGRWLTPGYKCFGPQVFSGTACSVGHLMRAVHAGPCKTVHATSDSCRAGTSIATVGAERNPHDSLFSRQRAINRPILDRLSECRGERQSLDTGHIDAAVIPIAFYPHWRLRFAR